MDKREQQRSTELESTPQLKAEPLENCNLKVSDTNASSTDAYLTERNGHHYAGRHYILDFWGMDNLTDKHHIESALRDASTAAKATLLHIHLHEFTGGGITGVALLAESHMSIHTWPEHDYAAFDIFMCGQSEAEKAVALLTSAFSPAKYDIKELLRGKVD